LIKALFILPLLATLVLPIWVPQTPAADDSQITVLGFKWSKVHQTASASGDKPLPARAVTQSDKNLERNSRINDPAGVRDPNADTVDARSQELEKASRAANTAAAKTTDAFAYQAKIHNGSKNTIEIIFWEYQVIDAANPANTSRRQFLCGINLKPDKDKELQALSSLGPTTVNAANVGATTNPGQEKVIINRVEFADGKSWMRKDWNASEIKESYKRAMATPWSPNEVCRAL
jgi:hypothetical protein